MFPDIDFTQTNAYKLLCGHFQEIGDVHMADLFKEDAGRFDKYSLSYGDMLLDYSKNRITDTTINLLIRLAEQCELKEAIKAMFSGEKDKPDGRPGCVTYRVA